MLQIQFDVKRMNVLQNIMIRLRDGEIAESIRADYETHFIDIEQVQQLLMIHELVSSDNDITIKDVKRFFEMKDYITGGAEERINPLVDYVPEHPVHIFVKENQLFQQLIQQISETLASLEKQSTLDSDDVTKIQEDMFQLGEFHKHYHRKEKLLFPILERYGEHTPTRLMWRLDDRVRALYQGTKRQIDQLPDIDFTHVRQTYVTFKKEFLDMIYREEKLILPVLIATFTEDNWKAIAEESDAFGYALIEGIGKWEGSEETVSKSSTEQEAFNNIKHQDLPFGGGYLTVEEANLILNNLPLEITFVDKNSVFKYFNTITEASDMMLVRTPTSIGRNVADCHPPISLKKVMTLVRDLKTKRRISESMWIRKQGQYVHITYKALFNEADEFLGILEYVQDIQPFFDLPTEIKTGLSELDE